MAAQAKKVAIAELGAGAARRDGHVWVQGCIVSVAEGGGPGGTTLLIDDGSCGARCMRVRMHEKTVAHFGEGGPRAGASGALEWRSTPAPWRRPSVSRPPRAPPRAGMYVSVIAGAAPSSGDTFLATKVRLRPAGVRAGRARARAC